MLSIPHLVKLQDDRTLDFKNDVDQLLGLGSLDDEVRPL